MIRLAKAFVFFVIFAGGGAGVALSAEVDFGSLTPSPGGCSTSGSDPGAVCASTQSFSAIGDIFTATGFNNPFAPGDGALTLKSSATNTFAESGLGENVTGPGTPCTIADCGIDHLRGVAVAASGNPINDAIIGSFDPGSEAFNFFTGSSIASLSFFDTFGLGGASCTGPVAGTCLITGFGDAAVIAVEMNTPGSILITAVSATPSTTVPEPSTWAMMLLGFAGLGYAGFRRCVAMRRKSVSLVNV
jgi:hypothetical protein